MNDLLFVSLFVWPVVATIGVYHAYRNGVNDGYGYSQEPWNPGYRKAGDWLIKNATGRWPQLLKSQTPEQDPDDAVE